MSKRMSRYPSDRKVYVGDLGNNARKNELEYAFSAYGTLRSVWIARNPPGFAFVEFEDARDAADSVRGLDGRNICGRRVRVELSTGKLAGSGRDRRGSGRSRPFNPDDKCYECGGRGHYARDCRRLRPSSRRRSRSRSRSRSYSRDRRTRSRTGSRSDRSKSHSRSRSRSKSSRNETRMKSSNRSNERRTSRENANGNGDVHQHSGDESPHAVGRSSGRDRDRSTSKRRYNASRSKSRSRRSRSNSRNRSSRSRSRTGRNTD